MKQVLQYTSLWLLCLLPAYLHGQDILWKDVNTETRADDIAFDHSGNFWRFLEHGENFWLGDTLLEDLGAVLVKNNADGTIAFVQEPGLRGELRADRHDNMYVIGTYGGEFEIQGKVLPEPTGTGLAILKYSPKGRLIWATTYDGGGRVEELEMNIVNNQIKFACYYQQYMSLGTDTFKTTDPFGVLIGTLDSAGKSVKHQNNFLNNSITRGVYAFARNGEMTVGSAYQGSIQIGSATYTASGAAQNIIIVNLDNKGNINWVEDIQSVEPSIGFSTRVSAMAYTPNNHLLVGGVFKDYMRVRITGYAGASEEGFFMRYSNKGKLEWVKQIPMEAPKRLIPTKNGEWVVGATLGRYDDPSTDSCPAGYNDDRSIYTGTFDSLGNCIQIRTFGGSRDFFMQDVDAHRNGNIVFNGRAWSSLYLGGNKQYRPPSNGDLYFSALMGQCQKPKVFSLKTVGGQCTGDTITLHPKFAGTVDTMEWIKDGVRLDRDYSDDLFSIDSINSNDTGTYWLRISGDCGIDSMPFVIKVPYPKPSISLKGKDTFCRGDSGQVVLEFDGNAPFAYRIRLGSKAEERVSNAAFDTLYAKEAIKVKPIRIADAYCAQELGQDSLVFSIAELAEADFSYSVTAFDAKFTNKSKQEERFIWDFGDGTTEEDLNNPKHTYAQNGTYRVQLIVENNCNRDTFEQDVVIDAVGIDQTQAQELKLYPNPATNRVSLEQMARIKVYNAQGRLVLEKEATNMLDVSGLARGNYLVLAFSNDRMSKGVLQLR